MSEETAVQEKQEETIPSNLDDASLEAQIAGTQEDKKVEDSSVTPEKTEPTPVEKTEDEKVSISKTEWDKVQKQLTEQELFIKRRNNEVGDLRKKITDLETRKEELTKSVEAEGYIDPVQTHKNLKEIDTIEAEMTSLKVKEFETGNREIIKKIAPDFDNLLDDMATVISDDAKALGVPEEKINSFLTNWKTNPYIQADAGMLLGYASRARLIKDLREKDSKIAELTKKPGEVAKKIENALKSSPVITASSGQGESQGSNVNVEQIADLSDSELMELIKKGSA
jgi:hypothetical protein